jgi:hypothetical protein
MKHLLSDSSGIDVIGCDEPHRIFEIGDRRNHAERITMGLNDHRVGISQKKRIYRPEMARRFQDPSFRHMTGLPVLKESAMVFVGRRHVLFEEPVIVALDIEGHLESHAHEFGSGGNDALLRH